MLTRRSFIASTAALGAAAALPARAAGKSLNFVLAEPVAEFTIAGNLKDMFLNITPANDLEFRRGTDAPTLRVEGMILAGS